MQHQKRYILYALFLLACTSVVQAEDSVWILYPEDRAASISGNPLMLEGRASQVGFRVRLTINTTEIGSAITDDSGFWSFTTYDVWDGLYTATADLMDSRDAIIATTTISFTVHNPPIISIENPEDGAIVGNPVTVSGRASLPLAKVII